ncbi:MAG: bifunctional diaminohydroxyphosphoribosylaminopyrimidine deaminase/5-amino-6-(5-phosphoribosylamino)uracil reductase RibD [Gemmatimonadetes bacterium]|nr:bifunctional diaminohydroxyphosphoribosylaminopyrimidine deaminase/5-amino-6-(5-phosphoribosylamino)uracil reductase RibD [Gemmatimonadota bacterium]
MRRALWLAERGGGATSPNPMVGCILLGVGGEAIGEGWHARAGGPHAEAVALEAARAARRDPHGGTAVISLEPCAHHGRTPPCADALVEAGIARVVFSLGDPAAGSGGATRLREAGVEVVEGVLAEESRRLNEAWLSFEESGRPLVHLKVAHTLSGHVTRGAGKARWISGPAAQSAVHRLRRRHPAVLVGIGTALADDPLLTVRDWPPAGGPVDDPTRDDHPWPDVQPIRVVLDSGLRLPPESRLVGSTEEAGLLVLCGESAPAERREALVERGVEVDRIGSGESGLDLAAVLGELARRGITGLLVEPGPTLAAAFLRSGLTDRWTAFVAADADVAGDAVALYGPAGPLPPFDLEDVRTATHGRDVEISGRVET